MSTKSEYLVSLSLLSAEVNKDFTDPDAHISFTAPVMLSDHLGIYCTNALGFWPEGFRAFLSKRSFAVPSTLINKFMDMPEGPEIPLDPYLEASKIS